MLYKLNDELNNILEKHNLVIPINNKYQYFKQLLKYFPYEIANFILDCKYDEYQLEYLVFEKNRVISTKKNELIFIPKYHFNREIIVAKGALKDSQCHYIIDARMEIGAFSIMEPVKVEVLHFIDDINYLDLIIKSFDKWIKQEEEICLSLFLSYEYYSLKPSSNIANFTNLIYSSLQHDLDIVSLEMLFDLVYKSFDSYYLTKMLYHLLVIASITNISFNLKYDVIVRMAKKLSTVKEVNLELLLQFYVDDINDYKDNNLKMTFLALNALGKMLQYYYNDKYVKIFISSLDLIKDEEDYKKLLYIKESLGY